MEMYTLWRNVGAFLLSFGLFTSCSTPSEESTPSRSEDREAIHSVLNTFHKAASRADSKTYFGSLAGDSAIFIGTDDTERWNTQQFKKWSEPYFIKDNGWTFVPVERFIGFYENTAWVDEKLDSQHQGRCRGTAILLFQNGQWKITHYTLSLSVPNEKFDEVFTILHSD